MFPDEITLTETEIATVDETADTVVSGTIGRSIKFDYEKKEFVINDGKNVEPSKIDAIKQWIELFISSFGVDLRDLVGYRLPRGYQVAEIMRRINEGILTKCPDVASVSDWNFDKGTFSFTVKTNTGEEVVIYGY